MKKTSKSLAKKLAATFGAAVLASAMMAPAAFAADYNYDWATDYPDAAHGSQEDTATADSADASATVTDQTAVFLKVKDDATRTISVTAPLAIYLAADYDSSLPDANLDVDLMRPSKDICYIQNYSKTVDLKVNGWTVSTSSQAVAGKTKTAYDAAVLAGPYASENTSGVKQGDYYLTCLFDNTNCTANTKPVFDLAVNSGEDLTTANTSNNATLMTQNANAGDKVANTFLPMELNAHMYNPDGAANAFGQNDGAQLQNITWSFNRAAYKTIHQPSGRRTAHADGRDNGRAGTGREPLGSPARLGCGAARGGDRARSRPPSYTLRVCG